MKAFLQILYRFNSEIHRLFWKFFESDLEVGPTNFFTFVVQPNFHIIGVVIIFDQKVKIKKSVPNQLIRSNSSFVKYK